MAAIYKGNYTYEGESLPAIYVFDSPYTEGACPLFGGLLTQVTDGYEWIDGTDEIQIAENTHEIFASSDLLTVGESYVLRIYATDVAT